MLDNHRWERFAHGIAHGKHAKDAYIEAGYKARGNSAEAAASRLLRNHKVQQRIEELAEEVKNQAIADAEEIQRYFTSVMRGEVDEQLMTRSGDLVTARANVRDRNMAAKTLAQARGVFDRTDGDDDGELDALMDAIRQSPRPQVN